MLRSAVVHSSPLKVQAALKNAGYAGTFEESEDVSSNEDVRRSPSIRDLKPLKNAMSAP